jgi:ferrous iron transport protein B
MKNKSDNMIVALAGQPNAGKSTIFNMLTGARQHVANYPGVTVEKKTGRYNYKGNTVALIDLPGTYSLTSYSPEERIARDFLLHEKPVVVLNIVDASNLERNLYLTFQLAEIGIPLVIALNMMDVAGNRGLKIDKAKLSELLKAPVVPTVGSKGRGKKELKEAISTASGNMGNEGFRVNYGKEVESSLSSLEKTLSDDPKFFAGYPTRWLSVKLIEGDSEARRLIELSKKERQSI